MIGTSAFLMRFRVFNNEPNSIKKTPRRFLLALIPRLRTTLRSNSRRIVLRCSFTLLTKRGIYHWAKSYSSAPKKSTMENFIISTEVHYIEEFQGMVSLGRSSLWLTPRRSTFAPLTTPTKLPFCTITWSSKPKDLVQRSTLSIPS